jgi:hypothetical protein
MTTRSGPVKPRIFAVRFTKAQFMSLSLAERELLIRIGLAQNDLLMMQRLWGALYYRSPTSVAAADAHAVQQVTLLLVLVGKLYEALETFRTGFLSIELSRRYLAKFNERQREAVNVLKRALGTSQLIARVRNDFAFHYHKSGRLSRFMTSWTNDRLLTMYFADPDANTLNAYAAEPFLRALMRRTGRRTPTAALRHIQNTAAKIIAAHSTFVGAVQLAALRSMFNGNHRPEELDIGEDEYLPHDQFRMPFFAGIPSRPPREIRAELKKLRDAQRKEFSA